VLASSIAKFLKHVYFQTEAKWHEKIHQSLEAENKHHQTSRSLQPSWASQLPRRKNKRDKWCGTVTVWKDWLVYSKVKLMGSIWEKKLSARWVAMEEA